jgi:hypothetical protein
MDTRAVIALATRERFSLSECQELAKDLDAWNSLTFELVGPKGRKPAKWLDAYCGLFQLKGSDGFLSVSQFKYAQDLWCENLRASGIETEGHDPAEGHGAKHESPAPKGDAQP